MLLIIPGNLFPPLSFSFSFSSAHTHTHTSRKTVCGWGGIKEGSVMIVEQETCEPDEISLPPMVGDGLYPKKQREGEGSSITRGLSIQSNPSFRTPPPKTPRKIEIVIGAWKCVRCVENKNARTTRHMRRVDTGAAPHKRGKTVPTVFKVTRILSMACCLSRSLPLPPQTFSTCQCTRNKTLSCANQEISSFQHSLMVIQTSFSMVPISLPKLWQHGQKVSETSLTPSIQTRRTSPTPKTPRNIEFGISAWECVHPRENTIARTTRHMRRVNTEAAPHRRGKTVPTVFKVTKILSMTCCLSRSLPLPPQTLSTCQCTPNKTLSCANQEISSFRMSFPPIQTSLPMVPISLPKLWQHEQKVSETSLTPSIQTRRTSPTPKTPRNIESGISTWKCVHPRENTIARTTRHMRRVDTEAAPHKRRKTVPTVFKVTRNLSMTCCLSRSLPLPPQTLSTHQCTPNKTLSCANQEISSFRTSFPPIQTSLPMVPNYPSDLWQHGQNAHKICYRAFYSVQPRLKSYWSFIDLFSFRVFYSVHPHLDKKSKLLKLIDHFLKNHSIQSIPT